MSIVCTSFLAYMNYSDFWLYFCLSKKKKCKNNNSQNLYLSKYIKKIAIWCYYFWHTSQKIASTSLRDFLWIHSQQLHNIYSSKSHQYFIKRLFITHIIWFTSLIVKILCNNQVLRPKGHQKNRAAILKYCLRSTWCLFCWCLPT